MEQKLIQLQAKVEADKSFGEKIFALETPEEVQSLLKAEGLDFSLEEINVLRNALVKTLGKGDGELSDDDLENVAGGSIILGVAALITAIAGAVTAAGAVTDQAVRSRW
ncbi:MAG: Nif11-like leader peptide family natural product precursor [Syntrophomonadaceae bacterium]|nr:Nif11-like leader peptide family natural product precursor [Syntrophomonadaceae bacterium]